MLLFMWVLFLGQGAYMQSEVVRPLFTFQKLFLREDIVGEQLSLRVKGTWTFQTKEALHQTYNRWQQAFDYLPLATEKKGNVVHTMAQVEQGSTKEIAHLYWVEKNGKFQMVVWYEQSGQVTGSKDVHLLYYSFLDQYRKFSDPMLKNVHFYTCINGHLGDKMNVAVKEKVSSFLHTLHATPVEEMNEETFISTSAYIEYWKAFILVRERKMNVQLSMKLQKNDQIHVTIGTPIITTEY